MSNVRKISAIDPITNPVATGRPPSSAVVIPPHQPSISRRLSVRAAPIRSEWGAAPSSACFPCCLTLATALLPSGELEEQGFGEGLDLHPHLLEHVRLLLELHDQMRDALLVEGAAVGDLLLEPGLPHLRAGSGRCLRARLADAAHEQ